MNERHKAGAFVARMGVLEWPLFTATRITLGEVG